MGNIDISHFHFGRNIQLLWPCERFICDGHREMLGSHNDRLSTAKVSVAGDYSIAAPPPFGTLNGLISVPRQRSLSATSSICPAGLSTFFPSKMFRWKWLWFTEWVLPIQRNLKWIETHRRTKREKKSGWLSRFKWNRTDGSSATQPPLRTTPHPVHGTNSEFQPKYFANMFICIWSNWKWIQLFFFQ